MKLISKRRFSRFSSTCSALRESTSISKKKIGTKGGLRNIPDGYLIDLSGPTARLFVVENELASHDHLRHIAVQILQFSLSFEDEPRTVHRILIEAILAQTPARTLCEQYVADHPELRSLDHLVSTLVSESPFTALVIIDEIPDNLERVLADRFQFGVEVMVVARYRSESGEDIYQFEPFLDDIAAPRGERLVPNVVTPVDSTLIDTIVVPAREDGFQETFLGEQRWHHVRIHGSMRPQIKYIAAYRTAPSSAITHIAPVSSIEPWERTGKYVLNFAEPAREIGPVKVGNRVKPLQNLRYTNHERLERASTLDEVW